MKRFLILIALCFSLTSAFAQEGGVPNNCGNGIDDDGDGRIDCFDGNCIGATACEGFYIVENVCDAPPPEAPTFEMTLDFASPDETVNHLSRIAIGDLSGDGIPEIVTMEKYDKKLFILRGSNGSVYKSITVSYEPIWEVAIANIDNGNAGCGEIFIAGLENNIASFYAYDCELNLLWQSVIRDGGGKDPINYGLADFDGDGKVELYAKDIIFDAHTGTRIISTSTANGTEFDNINGGPVAVDMDPQGPTNDGRLELVIGLKIYDVNLGSRTANSGSLTLRPGSPTNYFIRFPYNATSVADYNQDGHLDILASGSDVNDASPSPTNNERTVIFFWDVHNNVVKTFYDTSPGAYNPTNPGTNGYGWKNGTGRINIADIDGDGKLNASYVSGKFLYALDENLNLKWRKTINEETSGHTGCTLFDFVGDGSSEIVYRDEQYLYIIDGSDGSVHTQERCISRTNREYPIVADVDADGSTEICVPCMSDDNATWADFNDNAVLEYPAEVRVYRSATTPWVPARRVWNQHGYFNVNINDNLTIPRKMQFHHVEFSVADCRNTGTDKSIRPLNSFLNQTPFLDTYGCPVYATADLDFATGSTITVNAPTCPNVNFTVSFELTNRGDLPISGNIPMTFYTGNPRRGDQGAIKLNTINVALSGLTFGEIVAVNNVQVNGIGADSLWVVLNDAGTYPAIPIPDDPTNSTLTECPGQDYMGVPVEFIPAPLTATVINDSKCPATTTLPNGSASAFVPTSGGGQNTTDYNFYWEDGASPAPSIPGDHTGPTYTQLGAGQYTVFARHKTVNCGSDTTTVTVVMDPPPLFVPAINPENPYNNCKNPNGKLSVAVTINGTPQATGKYTYQWVKGVLIGTDPVVSSSHIATNLIGATGAGQVYTVFVTDKATGCTESTPYNLKDESVPVVVSAQPQTIACSASAQATLTVDNAAAGFKYEWFDGSNVKPSPDHVGSSYANLGAGSYTVVATDNNTQCESPPLTVAVTQTTPPSVTASATADMTSCDPSQPNGSVNAQVVGNVADFTFEWFRGQNTLPANKIAGATTPTVNGLAAGVYTVKVTSIANSCTATADATIDFNVVSPTLTIAGIGSVTNCTTANGSIEVNVSLDTPADYTFSWYIGTSVKATPDFADTDNRLEGLPVGVYTVKAVHNTKHCEAPPIQASVLDNTPTIVIDQLGAVRRLPTDCALSNGRLRITVGVQAPATNVNKFLIEWFKDGSSTLYFSETGVDFSEIDTLQSGLYTIRATNLDNGCSDVKVFDLPFANAPQLTLVDTDDAITCTPKNEGRIIVKLMPTDVESPGPPPTSFTFNDYNLEFYNGSGMNPPATIRAGSTGSANGDATATTPETANYTYSTLTPGFYTIVAIENHALLKNCRSVPVIVEIKDTAVPPVIATSPIPINTGCGLMNGTGVVTLTLDGGAPHASYTSIDWFEGVNTTVSLPTNTSGTKTATGASNLPAGQYTVRVINAANCESTALVTVLDNPPTIAIMDGGVVPSNVMECKLDPSDPGSGEARIDFIHVNGVQQPIAGYTFEWLDDNQAVIPNTDTAPFDNISGLDAGTYYVRATDAGNCTSSLVEFVIIDETPNTPSIALDSFTDLKRCPEVLGSLAVVVTTASGTTPDVKWYAGPAVTAPGTHVFDGTNFTGIAVPARPATDATFTVQAMDLTTNCKSEETYVLPIEISTITVSVSAEPVTFCKTPFDGSLVAAVTSAPKANYTYDWVDDQGVPWEDNTNGDDLGEVSEVPSGIYTVTATEIADNQCFVVSDPVEVRPERVPPVATAEAMMPNTHCDLATANGVASVSVGGNISNYTFTWYEGVEVPFVDEVGTGPQVSVLADGIVYSIVAEDIVTHCSDTTTVTVPNGTVILSPSQVQISVLSNVTTCQEGPDSPAPNGALVASVNGNVSGYEFFWYDADPASNAPVFTGSEFFSGPSMEGLDVGQYWVSVVDRVTGCPGGPATATIIRENVYPEFVFETEDATCKKNDLEVADGYVTIMITNGNDIDVDKIEWFDVDGSFIVDGPNLMDADAGIYNVTVTTREGCSASKPVELKSEIRPFNGISRNGDGMNDFFLIKCLEQFPNNIVKIFNRAGTLVYMEENYDNIDIFFDGRSNKGVSMMGTNLPDGTYFYVIDKGDGSKPVAGYLEIVN